MEKDLRVNESDMDNKLAIWVRLCNRIRSDNFMKIVNYSMRNGFGL